MNKAKNLCDILEATVHKTLQKMNMEIDSGNTDRGPQVESLGIIRDFTRYLNSKKPEEHIEQESQPEEQEWEPYKWYPELFNYRPGFSVKEALSNFKSHFQKVPPHMSDDQIIPWEQYVKLVVWYAQYDPDHKLPWNRKLSSPETPDPEDNPDVFDLDHRRFADWQDFSPEECKIIQDDFYQKMFGSKRGIPVEPVDPESLKIQLPIQIWGIDLNGKRIDAWLFYSETEWADDPNTTTCVLLDSVDGADDWTTDEEIDYLRMYPNPHRAWHDASGHDSDPVIMHSKKQFHQDSDLSELDEDLDKDEQEAIRRKQLNTLKVAVSVLEKDLKNPSFKENYSKFDLKQLVELAKKFDNWCINKHADATLAQIQWQIREFEQTRHVLIRKGMSEEKRLQFQMEHTMKMHRQKQLSTCIFTSGTGRWHYVDPKTGKSATVEDLLKPDRSLLREGVEQQYMLENAMSSSFDWRTRVVDVNRAGRSITYHEPLLFKLTQMPDLLAITAILSVLTRSNPWLDSVFRIVFLYCLKWDILPEPVCTLMRDQTPMNIQELGEKFEACLALSPTEMKDGAEASEASAMQICDLHEGETASQSETPAWAPADAQASPIGMEHDHLVQPAEEPGPLAAEQTSLHVPVQDKTLDIPKVDEAFSKWVKKNYRVRITKTVDDEYSFQLYNRITGLPVGGTQYFDLDRLEEYHDMQARMFQEMKSAQIDEQQLLISQTTNAAAHGLNEHDLHENPTASLKPMKRTTKITRRRNNRKPISKRKSSTKTKRNKNNNENSTQVEESNSAALEPMESINADDMGPRKHKSEKVAQSDKSSKRASRKKPKATKIVRVRKQSTKTNQNIDTISNPEPSMETKTDNNNDNNNNNEATEAELIAKLIAKLFDLYQTRAKTEFPVEYAYFEYPVDGELLPDYYERIKTPMCYEMIQSKILSLTYSIVQFLTDFKLIGLNARAYNRKKVDDAYEASERFDHLFRSLLPDHLKKAYDDIPTDIQVLIHNKPKGRKQKSKLNTKDSEMRTNEIEISHDSTLGNAKQRKKPRSNEPSNNAPLREGSRSATKQLNVVSQKSISDTCQQS